MRKAREESSESESETLAKLGDCAAKLGYKTLKKEQQEAIVSFVKNQDVFVCLPTGFGKSLCYFCLPSLFDSVKGKCDWSVAVVVSPLVALMADQVEILKAKGVSSAVCINNADSDRSKKGICEGTYRIIFTNPETLFDKDWTDIWQSSYLSERIIALVIDEAHCVKKWGKEFRKEFGKLGELRGFFPSDLHIMALTATASRSTREEVIRLLGMKKPVVILRPPDKPNIFYSVFEKNEDLDSTFKSLVEEVRYKRLLMDRTIVFCRTYQDCSDLYLYFRSVMGKEFTNPIGSPDYPCFRLVDMFTACNTSFLKKSILKSFCDPKGHLRIIVATIAFGMGIDCPNVKQIVHWGPPSSVESYIQETGRAGRDGEIAHVKLYYSKRDISLSFMEESMVAYCKNTKDCRRQVLFKDFDYLSDDKPVGCVCCDICSLSCSCTSCIDM